MPLGAISQDGTEKQKLRTKEHCGVDIDNIYISIEGARLKQYLPNHYPFYSLLSGRILCSMNTQASRPKDRLYPQTVCMLNRALGNN